MNPKVDTYLSNTKRWTKELEALRTIVLECGLTEELKWKNPCYTYNNKNVILLGEFKEYCVISFLKGILLADFDNLLVSPGENSQSVKVIKFTDVKTILELRATIKAYIFETIELEKSGAKVEKTKSTDFELVEELTLSFKKSPELKEAFENLTTGRQRAYNMFFEAAKQSKTRVDRIEKYIPRILSGKGMNDCVCGMSKKMPQCDGSHRFI